MTKDGQENIFSTFSLPLYTFLKIFPFLVDADRTWVDLKYICSYRVDFNPIGRRITPPTGKEKIFIFLYCCIFLYTIAHDFYFLLYCPFKSIVNIPFQISFSIILCIIINITTRWKVQHKKEIHVQISK